LGERREGEGGTSSRREIVKGGEKKKKERKGLKEKDTMSEASRRWATRGVSE